jgi:hypothetical protein
MHLTNYAVNKHSRTYIVDDEAGSKRYVAAGLMKDISNLLKLSNEQVKARVYRMTSVITYYHLL